MPDLTVVKIGGQSIIDRGRKALLPILDELVEARLSRKILIATGGTRARRFADGWLGFAPQVAMLACPWNCAIMRQHNAPAFLFCVTLCQKIITHMEEKK